MKAYRATHLAVCALSRCVMKQKSGFHHEVTKEKEEAYRDMLAVGRDETMLWTVQPSALIPQAVSHSRVQ